MLELASIYTKMHRFFPAQFFATAYYIQSCRLRQTLLFALRNYPDKPVGDQNDS